MENRLFIKSVFLLWLFSGCVADKQTGSLPQATTQRMKEITDSVMAGISPDDTFSHDGALFLLENLKHHHFIYSKATDDYTEAIFKFHKDRDRLEKELSALKMTVSRSADTIFDAEVLTSRFLRDHILRSTTTLRNVPWRNDLSFDVFNEYVLPYRIYDEAASLWQWNSHYVKKAMTDSLALANNIREAAAVLHSSLVRNKKSHFSILFGKKSLEIPSISLEAINLLPTGSCHELSLYTQAVLRSYGIPATTDIVPHYVNVNSGHEWCSIVIDSSAFIPFDIANDQLGRYKNDRFRMSKVYRRTFSPNPSAFRMKYGENKFLPLIFRDPFFKDVTPLYTRTCNIKIPVIPKTKHNVAFLTVFGAPSWVPVDYGEIIKDTVEFKNIGYSNGVHLPAIITEKGYLPLGSAFILTENGSIEELIPDTALTETIRLTRKFPIELFQADKHHRKMIGGIFKGANRSDFADAEVLYTVTASPGDGYNEVRTDNSKKWRYVLYEAPPGSHGNVAEIEVYSDEGKALTGIITGTSGSWQNTSTKTKEAAFDKNPLTFFDAAQPDGNWVGLKLNEPLQISRIRYLARGDMNGIYPHNEYELFYWNNTWVSLGRQSAIQSFLVYDNVPRNALLWLRNLTAGKEERIFTWKGGKQVWW